VFYAANYTAPHGKKRIADGGAFGYFAVGNFSHGPLLPGAPDAVSHGYRVISAGSSSV